MLGKIISVRPQLIQKVTDQAAHSYTQRIPARTQIVLHISLKINSHEEHQELQAGISQQNPQAQAFIWIIQITASTCICTSPQAQFNNSHKSHTHAHTPPPLSSLFSKHHGFLKNLSSLFYFGFPSLRTLPYSIPQNL